MFSCITDPAFLIAVLPVIAVVVSVIIACPIISKLSRSPEKRGKAFRVFGIITIACIFVAMIICPVISCLMYPGYWSGKEPCPACSTLIAESAKYCPSCGTECTTPYCGSCGTQMLPGN